MILFDLCYLAGRLDISSNKACSEAMHTFINKILKYGLLLHTQNPNINSIPKEVGHYDTKRFSKQLQAIGKEEFQSTLKLCKSIRYINLAVDAGTVLQYHCLHSLITNPYYNQFPRLLETYEIKIAYTAEQYSEYFSIVTSQLIELGIQICGIVIDNLPVQVKGLNDWITNNQDNRVRAIVHVPCLAHSLNLVFTNTYKDNYLLHKITNNIIELSSMLRTTEAINFIGKIFPLPIKTRWFYVCDIISFVFDNKNEIESYMLATKPDLSEYIISNKINLLHQILYPVRYLILIFEKTSAHLWQLVEATKKFQEMMNHSWELIRNEDEEWKELFKVIIARTLSRISTTCHDEVITGYVLSLNGRDEIRQIQHGMRGFNMSNSVHSHGMLFPDISNQYQLDSHEENVNVDQFDDEIVTTRVNVDKIEEIMNNQLNDDQNCLQWNTHKQVFEDLMERNIEDLLNINIYHDKYAIALKTLQSHSDLLYNIDHETVKNMFDTFLFENDQNLIFLQDQSKSPNDFWRDAHSLDDWKIFSEIALHFITFPCSEADVERLFSAQKTIMGKSMTNINSEVLEARVRLHGKQSLPD